MIYIIKSAKENTPIYLGLHDSEWAAQITKDISLNSLYYFSKRAWPGPTLSDTAFEVAFRQFRPIEPGMFVWPRGAARFAYAYYLASAAITDQVRSVAYGDGTQSNKFTLHLDSPGLSAGEYIEVPMYLLPPVPLYRLTSNGASTLDGLYLLVFVDVRWFWQWTNIGQIDLTKNYKWSDMFTLAASSLGITNNFTWDVIPTAYLNPSITMLVSFANAALFLDAVCYNVGHRFVANFDGSFVTQNYQSAAAARQKSIANGSQRTMRAGGIRMLDTV